VFILSSVALPGTNNFIGELLILFGLFSVSPGLAVLLGLTVILSAVYFLRLMQKVYFEKPVPFQHQWVDLKHRELWIVVPFVALIFWIGIYPAPILELSIRANPVQQEKR
jgi:NADH-quinone oxidoreductase subunit M